MTTLTKKELMEKIETLQWEKVGYKETIRSREAMVRNAVAEGKKREEELTESWVLDSNKTIAYIHELQAELADSKEALEEMTDTAEKHYLNYREEINFGQRNQFKAYEEIEALKTELAGCDERAEYWYSKWTEQRKELKKANR